MKTAKLGKLLAPVVEASMKETEVPGVAVGLRLDGEDHTFGFGVTSIEAPLPVDGETMFQIGSTTKTFTGTAVMQLVEDGRLALSDPVVKHLPSLKLADAEVTKRVTVQHLLTHTGGWLGDYFDDLGRGDDALRKIVARMAKKTPQLTPLGSVWSYNNAGFYVAGRLIETLWKKSYESVVASRVFAPLGMERSFFFPEQVMTYKTAVGHVRSARGLRVARPWGLSRAANPAGGIASTAVDQLKYATLHLGAGDGVGVVLSKSSITAMQKPLAPAGSMAEHVGVTWLLDRVGGVRVVKHGGTVNGNMSAFALVPSRGFAVTVLTNGDRGHEVNHAVTSWAYRELLGLADAEPALKPLGKKAAKEYAGRYAYGAFGTLVVDAEDGRLAARIELSEEAAANEDLVAVVPPPFAVGLVGRDRGVVLGERAAGRRVEFVRDADGSVAWIRHGGRILRRLD